MGGKGNLIRGLILRNVAARSFPFRGIESAGGFFMLIKVVREDEFFEAYEWTLNAPEWLKTLERICGRNRFTDYHKEWSDPALVPFGVYDPYLSALITVAERQKGIFEVDFFAPRSASPQLLTDAGNCIRDEMFGRGMRGAYSWVASINRPALWINRAVGFRRTGVSLLKGQHRGRCIEWLKLGFSREEWLSGRPENQNHAADDAGEYLRLQDAEGHARHLYAT